MFASFVMSALLLVEPGSQREWLMLHSSHTECETTLFDSHLPEQGTSWLPLA